MKPLPRPSRRVAMTSLDYVAARAAPSWSLVYCVGPNGPLLPVPGQPETQLVSVSSVTAGDQVHYLATGRDGSLFHTIRWPNRSWQSFLLLHPLPNGAQLRSAAIGRVG